MRCIEMCETTSQDSCEQISSSSSCFRFLSAWQVLDKLQLFAFGFQSLSTNCISFDEYVHE